MIFVLSLAGCSDVIDVDLETAPPKLVVDASIDWLKGTNGNVQKIRLSTTTGYYSNEFPTVSGATIFVTNSSNKVFNFREGEKHGEYICTDFLPVIGNTYSLTVIVGSETYTAVETLIGSPSIDSTFTQNNEGGMMGDEKEIEYSFQDDGSQQNYYMTRVERTRIAFPQFSLESDEDYQGKKITQYYSHADHKAGDVLGITLYGVSKTFFDYFGKILIASGNDDSPFPATPTIVKGNIVNKTREGNYALGYFRLSEVSTRSYTFE